MRTLDSYLKEAKVMILKWGQGWMIKDDQIVGDVANAIIRAENNYKPDHDSGAAMSTLRVTYGRNEILNTYRKRRAVTKRGTHHSIDKEHDSPSGKPFTFAEALEDKSEHFIDTILNEDAVEENKEEVRKILEHPYLSKRQKQYLDAKYMEGLTSKEIAEKFNVSKQAVSEGLLKGLSKLKEIMSA